jgi:hypothetical protein
MTVGSFLVLALFLVLLAIVVRGWVRAERWRRSGGGVDRFFEPPKDDDG